MGIDYADWLTPERLVVEEQHWAADQLYRTYAAGIRRLVREGNTIRTVLEFGAGTGWVPGELDDLVLDQYVCVDRNPGCVAKAHARNAHRRSWVEVWNMDIRDLHPRPNQFDLVCGFAVLKHFHLEEWISLFAQLFQQVRYGLFTIPLGATAVDDGVEHTHVRLPEAFVLDAIARAGHRETWRDTTNPFEPLFAIERHL